MKFYLISLIFFVAAVGLSKHWSSEATSSVALAQQHGSAAPVAANQCPTSHPIKGDFTPASGARCTFHAPGGQLYETTKPEKCYASPADAIADQCRAAKL